MNKILFFSLLFLPVTMYAQSVTRPGAPNSMSQDRGGIGADSVVRLPPTTVKFPNADSNRRIGVLPNGNLAVHSATVWNEQLPVKDSTRYITPTALTARGYIGSVTTTSSAATLSLVLGGWYVFTGTIATWTFPDPSHIASGSQVYFIKNRGTGVLTISSFAGSQIYTSLPVASLSLAAGESAILFFDSVYFSVIN